VGFVPQITMRLEFSKSGYRACIGVPMVGSGARRLYDTAQIEETPVPLGEPKGYKNPVTP